MSIEVSITAESIVLHETRHVLASAIRGGGHQVVQVIGSENGYHLCHRTGDVPQVSPRDLQKWAEKIFTRDNAPSGLCREPLSRLCEGLREWISNTGGG
jgi:hypothetical protein